MTIGTGSMDVTENVMESARFGVRFARLTLADDDMEALGGVLDRADADGIDVTSVRADTLSLATVRALEDAGFRLMDTLVYYRRSLSPELTDRMEGAGKAGSVIVPLSAADAEAAAAISRSAFAGYLGHYHADPRLADDAATEAYADWIYRALRTPTAGQVALGCTVEGRLAGFILGLPRAGGSSEITLNAVHPDAQRGGVYRALLRRYLVLAQAHGDHDVLISTQLQNHAVQRVWSREGFLLSHAWHTLHRWAVSSNPR